MKRPAFMFYAGDWRSNAKLRRCTFAERGIWLEVMCLMHDSDEYGVLRWPLKDIAQAIGCSVRDLRALRAKDVLKGADEAEQCAAFIYRPRHAGREGDPVELIAAQPGPIWYSSRMVRDEHIRLNRGQGTRFGDTANPTPNPRDGETPNATPTRREGDGPSVAVAVAGTSVPYGTVVPDGTPLPDCPHEEIIRLYHEALPDCPRVLSWESKRRATLRARWKEFAKPNGATSGYRTVADGLTEWRRFFAYAAESRFLTGRVDGRSGQPPFVADLEWLVKPSNFVKVLEGKYHR